MLALVRRRLGGVSARAGAGLALAAALVLPASRVVASVPAVRVVRDVAYGADPKQRFDVYVPRGARNAPVILMVHGGGWRIGDKRSRGVVGNKVERWSRAGIVVVSVNYRMLPGADPVEQARDVARALAGAQARLAEWGGDPGKVVLIGHSAGAHLVALLDAHPSLATSLGAHAWLGAVILDSAALDVVQTMTRPHLPLYTDAFGADRAFWREASPSHHLAAGAKPVLLVCSSLRRDSCPAATRFAAKATSVGVRAAVLPVPKTHAAIDAELGAPGEYTEAVEVFLRTLDPSLSRAIAAR
ncbi:MAG: alpha/beta hydrolase [Gemmatimonadaceae bacterium]